MVSLGVWVVMCLLLSSCGVKVLLLKVGDEVWPRMTVRGSKE